MKMKQIEVFHAVYSTGSVSNAARFLNVSQPAVSKVLHYAEDQLGYLLFKRIKGRMIPTDEAHALIGEVSQIYKNILSLQKKARNLKEGKAGNISLSVMPALGLNVLPLAIATFSKDNPGVTFDIQTRHYEDVIHSLYEYEVDVGLAFNPPNHAGLTKYYFGDGEFVCVFNEGDFSMNEERIDIHELEKHEIISIKDSGPLSEVLNKRLPKTWNFLDHLMTVQTYYVAKNLVGYGFGIAIVDQLTAMSEGPGNTIYKGFKDPIKYTVEGLFVEDRPLSNICKRFLDHFRKTYDEYMALESGHNKKL